MRPYRGHIGSLELKNRIVMAPMTRSLSPGGVPGADVAAYYRKRAEGGVGLIVTEGTSVPHWSASDDAAAPRFYGDDALAGWKHVVNEVHAAGSKIVPQLWHVGQLVKEADGTSRGHLVGPSGMTGGFGIMPRRMDEPATQQEIDEVIDAYATAALSAKALGFDGVELHGGHGYFLDQFFWAESNLRTDRYGGSVADRTRLAVEIVQEIKHRTGMAFPVVMRFSQFKLHDFIAKPFSTPADLEAFLRPLVDAGVDAFHASQRRFWEGEFGTDLNLAGWARMLSDKPAITVGSVTLKRDLMESQEGPGSEAANNLPRLREMMARGDFDFVAVGRALIANPTWPQKVRSGQPMVSFEASALAKLD
ncbi:12-oxophytodienoate reductase [Variovorax sp. J31P207]|uniref:oxidoreductase n=1 Tax=Variovorax sp. J31P207 TaxID=3053510 RepID=UPI002576DF00|nr:12-oxophytodienoate reductase [Variovorax sp. J31P207]MDM0071435.1 12-oxophytodienoate reductase [Variovorax sp. J31P207]